MTLLNLSPVSTGLLMAVSHNNWEFHQERSSTTPTDAVGAPHIQTDCT